MMLTYLSVVVLFFEYSFASVGDQSPFYKRCVQRCQVRECTREGFFHTNYYQPFALKMGRWHCKDECEYNCMWETLEVMHQNNISTPQFHGKWPFIRIFGIQEPASTLFSLLNLYAHVTMLLKFLERVQSDSPYYMLWIGYCAVCSHAWVWSAVFHWKDTELTEFFDYSSAFSIVLINCYVMLKRVIHYSPRPYNTILMVFFIITFSHHIMYLKKGKFDYNYHMQVNIFVGTCTAVCWLLWCYKNRNKQPYVWKCALYVILTILVLLLELIDHPPLFYVLDSHALWHLATAPLVVLIYSFAIDDCKYLREQQLKNEDREHHE